MAGKASWVWWLLPIFLSIIGGVIGYFILKDKDPKMAKNVLMLGAVLFVLGILLRSRGLFNIFGF